MAEPATTNTSTDRKLDRMSPHKRATESRLTLKQSAFLAAFSRCGVIRHAARAAKVSRRCHPRWLQKCDAYRAAFDDAKADALDELVHEARTRALGWTEPVLKGGKLVGHQRKHSDLLMIFLLKADLPGKYGKRSTVSSGTTPSQACVVVYGSPVHASEFPVV